jgi:hypothetical protein
LRKSMKSQNRWTRGPLAFIFGGLSMFTFMRIFASIAEPVLALEWQTFVANPLSFEMVLVSLFCQCVALFAATLIVYGVSNRYHVLAKNIGGIISLVPVMIWGKILFDPNLDWVMVWIPFSGILCILIALFVDSDSKQTEKGLEELEQMKYNFKSI